MIVLPETDFLMKKIALVLTAMALSASTPPEISIIVNTVSFADALPPARTEVAKVVPPSLTKRANKITNEIKSPCITARIHTMVKTKLADGCIKANCVMVN